MPRNNIAKHKELLSHIQNVQGIVEDLADQSYMNDEALRVLSNTNMELYENLKKMFDDVEKLKKIYTQTIYESRLMTHVIENVLVGIGFVLGVRDIGIITKKQKNINLHY